MSPWIKFILPSIGKSLAGVHWQDVVIQVKAMGSSTLSGDEKRQKVKAFVIDAGFKSAGFILNLVIEIAVAWLASQGALPTLKE